MEQVLFGCLSSSELHPEPWFQPSPFLSHRGAGDESGSQGSVHSVFLQPWCEIKTRAKHGPTPQAARIPRSAPCVSPLGFQSVHGITLNIPRYPQACSLPVWVPLLWGETKIFTGNRCYLPDLFPAAASNVQLSAVPGSSRCSEFVNTKLCLYRTELLVLVVWCSLKEIREEEQHHQFCCPRSQKQTGEWTLLWSKYFITELCHECHKKNIITFPQRF